MVVGAIGVNVNDAEEGTDFLCSLDRMALSNRIRLQKSVFILFLGVTTGLVGRKLNFSIFFLNFGWLLSWGGGEEEKGIPYVKPPVEGIDA